LSREDRLAKAGRLQTPDIVKKCEEEKQSAYDDGFRRGYLNLIYHSYYTGDLYVAFKQGYEAGEAKRKTRVTGDKNHE